MSISITSIVAITMLTVLSDLQKDVSDTQKNLEFQEISNLLDLAVSSQDNCAQLFEQTLVRLPIGESIPRELPPHQVVNIPTLKYKGSEIAQIGVRKNGLEPTFIGFNKLYRSFPAVGLSIDYFVVDFTLKARKKGFFRGREEKSKVLKLFLKTDSDGIILGCGPTDNEEGNCIIQGKTYNFSQFPFCQ